MVRIVFRRFVKSVEAKPEAFADEMNPWTKPQKKADGCGCVVQ